MNDILVTTDTKSLTRCYGLLAVGLPLTFMPSGPWAGIGIVLMLAGIIWAYSMRKRENVTPFVANHAQWMIRTFWIGGLFSILAIALAGMTVSANANNAAIAQMTALSQQEGKEVDPAQIQVLLDQFRADNAPLLLWATIGYLIMPVGFSIARFIHGYRLAQKGQMLPKVKSWSI